MSKFFQTMPNFRCQFRWSTLFYFLLDWVIENFVSLTIATKNEQPNFLGITQKHSSTNQNLLGNNQWPLSIGQLNFFWQLVNFCFGGPKKFDHQLWRLKVGNWKLLACNMFLEIFQWTLLLVIKNSITLNRKLKSLAIKKNLGCQNVVFGRLTYGD